jgi:predicted nucleotidyltransferase
MRDILFNLSGKIDQQTVAALLAIKKEADTLNISFFIVGACARDILLQHCYGINPRRMTTDIDLGINIADWGQFDKLIGSLIATGKFSPTRERQRYIFDSIFIDIVPFGAIAGEQSRIGWPPEHEIFMSIVGFKEAFENSIVVRLNSDPELNVKVSTLPGLAMMKLISWKEKYPERAKDAEDLLLIMQEYENAGNFDRFYEKEIDLLQQEGFDNQLAGIRLLGRDMATIADKDTAREIRSILDAETDKQSHPKLIIDMIRGKLVVDSNFDAINLQLEKLKQGFIEVSALKGEKIEGSK